jgi:hypothetical protein
VACKILITRALDILWLQVDKLHVTFILEGNTHKKNHMYLYLEDQVKLTNANKFGQMQYGSIESKWEVQMQEQKGHIFFHVSVIKTIHQNHNYHFRMTKNYEIIKIAIRQSVAHAHKTRVFSQSNTHKLTHT